MKIKHYSRKERQLKVLVKRLEYLLKKQDVQIEIDKISKKIKDLINILNGAINKFKIQRIVAGIALFLGVSLTNNVNAQYFAYPITEPFGLSINNHTVQSVAFADLDNDGDIDYLANTMTYGYYSYSMDFVYQENIGSANNPNFSTQNINPFGLTSQPTNSFLLRFPKFVDLDDDGDFDILYTEVSQNIYSYQMNSSFRYLENIGTPTTPQFGSPVSNPFGLSDTNQIVNINICDIDNDGDYDILSSCMANPPGGYGYGYPTTDVIFYENIGSNTTPSFASPQSNPFGLSSSIGFELKSLLDIDSDGDFDMMHFTYDYFSGGQITYLENTGSASIADFSSAPTINPFGLNISNYEANTIFAMHDLDGDGDGDLIGGNDYQNILYFENVLTQQPVTYECINNSCTDPGTGNGTYATLGDCQTNCFIPVSYECDFWSQSCFDPGDGSGFYASYNDCISDCVPPESYYCDWDGSCWDPGDGSGPYSSYNDCINDCEAQPTWNCISPGDCQDPGDASGQYWSLQACLDGCPVMETWNCDVTLGCVDPGDGSGLYASFSGCQSNCNSTALENTEGRNLIIYPNPVRNTLNISSKKKILKIEIYDAIGKKIISKENPTSYINVANIKSGIYTIAIIFEDNKIMRKFTK